MVVGMGSSTLLPLPSMLVVEMIVGTAVVVVITVIGCWARLGLVTRRHQESGGGDGGCHCPLGSCWGVVVEEKLRATVIHRTVLKKK